jgi:hypothetical protein
MLWRSAMHKGKGSGGSYRSAISGRYVTAKHGKGQPANNAPGGKGRIDGPSSQRGYRPLRDRAIRHGAPADDSQGGLGVRHARGLGMPCPEAGSSLRQIVPALRRRESLALSEGGAPCGDASFLLRA